MADGGSQERPSSDVFTALAIIATVFLATGTVYLAVRSAALFGDWMPFTF